MDRHYDHYGIDGHEGIHVLNYIAFQIGKRFEKEEILTCFQGPCYSCRYSF